MKRSGFKRQMRPKSEPNADRVRTMPTVTPGAFRAPLPVATTPAAQVNKDAPVRSEAYRRAIEDKHQGFSRYATDAEVQAYRQAI